jgi:hypothetical protein
MSLREGTAVLAVGVVVEGEIDSQGGKVFSCPGPNRCPTPVKAILNADGASTDGMRECVLT